MLDLVFNNSSGEKRFKSSFFKKILLLSLEELDLDNKRVEVSVNLVSKDKITSLNKKHRNKNKPTDVLSFPLGEEKIRKYGIIPLGDIFISPEVAEEKAKKYGLNPKEEMIRLVAHSLLHLFGYDHEKSAKDSKKMLDLEDKLIKKVKTP